MLFDGLERENHVFASKCYSVMIRSNRLLMHSGMIFISKKQHL